MSTISIIGARGTAGRTGPAVAVKGVRFCEMAEAVAARLGLPP